ncbi:MAG TPA: HAD-IIIC family phosphatase [Candidatus Methylacidiphilales bacterium]|nr:HAD-IIIC family phosphatase [Candidatus Methylacidiphilales bacterium]
MFEPDGLAAATEESVAARAAQIKAAWRRYSEETAPSKAEPGLRIGIAASFTANSLIPFAGAPLAGAGFEPSIKLAPYNQVFQTCLDYKKSFDAKCDVIVLIYRLEDIALEEITAFLHGDAEARRRASAKIDIFVSALTGLRDSFAGAIMVNLPPFPATLPAHGLSLENPLGLGALHRSLVAEFLEKTGGIRGLRFFDLDAVQRECGRAASFDSRQWYLYRQPFTDAFLLEAGALLSRMITATRRAPKKCAVLDCDNTLWGGIIGEDGLGGIELGDEFPGTAYRDFQRLLLYWRQQGVLLAIASKNNEADVWEVFEKHSGMLLQRDHISAWQINWNPKSENIPKIAQALNIGIDSLVFIDDNPLEIDQMRFVHPGVHSILLPEDPADILSQIQRLADFDRFEVTAEDRQRADMMRAEQQRETLSRTLTKEDFRRSLGLRLDFFLAQAEDLDRITQLINKTNQFNLTTIRRTLDEVHQLMNSPSFRIFGLRVSDKFGDYGLTGVIIAGISPDQAEWTLDTLLLSCRVLGRGVETALLAALAREARAGGATQLNASFIPTAKNAPAASFLPDHGFQSLDDNRWRIALAQIPEICSSITLVRGVSRGRESDASPA